MFNKCVWKKSLVFILIFSYALFIVSTGSMASDGTDVNQAENISNVLMVTALILAGVAVVLVITNKNSEKQIDANSIRRLPVQPVVWIDDGSDKRSNNFGAGLSFSF